MDRDSPLAAGAFGDKPRLSEQEKKNNHIASEQKRRQAIREGFDEIADLTPGMSGHGRSEAMVLEGASAFLKSLLAHRWRLLQKAQEMGIDTRDFIVDQETLRLAEEFYHEENSHIKQDGQQTQS